MPNITLQFIIDQATQLAAGVAADPHQSPLNDSGLTAETLFGPASRYAIKKLIAQGKIDECLVIHSITITNEIGELPANVFREFLEYAYLPDFPYASRCEYLGDYNRHRLGQIDYWTIQGNRIYFSGTLATAETTRAVINCTIVNTADTLEAPAGTGGFLADVTKRVVISVAAVDILDTTIIAATDDDNCQLQDPAPASSAAATATIYTTTGDALQLAAVSYPEIPNNLDDDLGISQTAANFIIVTIAAVLRGEMPLSELTEA